MEEMDYPYDVEENGSIVVMKALGRTQIDELVQMTERIRRKDTSFSSLSHIRY